jgi:hypothetical protein
MARHSRGDDHHDGDVPEPRSASDLLREAGYDVPEQRSRRRRRDHSDEHTMPPVMERTMFPYRRDEARRERAAAAEAARRDTEFDPSTYPPSPWPQPPSGGSRTGATRVGGHRTGQQPAVRTGQQPAVPQAPAAHAPAAPAQQRPGYPAAPTHGGGTGATPYRQGPYQPDPRQPGAYPAPPSHLPHLASAQPAPAAQARAQALPQRAPAPPPAQPVPARPGQSRAAQARLTQTGEQPVVQRAPWSTQQRGAYPGLDQPRPVQPRWEPDHTGQTGPHTWPPVSRAAMPELDQATELAPRPLGPAPRQPKPALPPAYEDRPLDARGSAIAPARPGLPGPAPRPGRPLPTALPGAHELETIDDDPPRRGGRGNRGRKGGRGASSRDEIELARAELAIEEDTSEFSSVAAIERRAERSDLIDPEPERTLLGAWLLFLVETVLAAGVGLGAWLGFHQLWRTQPYLAAGACGLVLVGMHAIVGWVRKRQTGSHMDLFSSCVVVAVGVAITVLPAAFAINPTP